MSAGAIPLPAGPPARRPGLDVLRGIAVLLVLGAHLSPPPVTRLGLSEWLFGTWTRLGPIGVDLFFVLSGFLVGGLLLREQAASGGIDWTRFFIRRGFKIYPAFWVLLAATVLVRWNLPRPATGGRVLAELLFVQNYFARVWTHTWSLAVEEHFYLLLPAILLAIRRPWPRETFRGLPAVCVSLMVAIGIARAATAWAAPYPREDVHDATHLRLDSLLCGVLVAWLYECRRAGFLTRVGRHRLAIGAGSLLVAAPAFWAAGDHDVWWNEAFGPTLLYLGFAGLLGLVLAARDRGPRGRYTLGAVAHIGWCSYSIYLWHLPVLLWGVGGLRAAGLRLPYPVEVLVFVALSLTVGTLLARTIELPLLRLRDRWFPSRLRDSGSPAASGERAGSSPAGPMASA